MAQRIAVIGAGIAGLATAVALQQRGYEVRVIEARTDTSTGAAISIWPNALAALDELGLGAAIREAGGRVAAGALRWRDGSWLRHPENEKLIAALGEPLVVVRRSKLRDVLTSALGGDTIEYGLEVKALVETASGVRVRLSDETVRDADAAIGADGIGSMVARHLNGPLNHRYAGYTAWRGIASCAIDPELAGGTVGPGVETGHVPAGASHTYWYATELTPPGGFAPEGELPYLRAKLADWPEPIPSVLAATEPAEVLRNDLYDRTPARQWAQGRVVLVGDAAHPMRPHLGQGGCQGIEDAAILGAFIDRTADLATAFARFATFRRPRVASLVRESALIGRAINLRPAILSTVVCRAAGLVPEARFTRHLASVAGRAAFTLPV